MHDLEDLISAFLKPMVVRAAVTPLDTLRVRQLAHWCIKTAMVYEFKNQQPVKYFSQSEREHVRLYGEPPPGFVRIWIGESKAATQAHGFSGYRRLTEGADPPVGYSLTFTARRFLFQVLACRPSLLAHPEGVPVEYTIPHGLLIKVWPNDSGPEVVKWPPPVSVNTDSLDAFDRRFWPKSYGDLGHAPRLVR
jgi:hypothetical protein